MQALAAAGLEPRFQPDFFQQHAHEVRSLLHRGPLHALSRVQIEQHPVRLPDGRLDRVPGVEFDHVHLHRGQDGLGRGHFEQRWMVRVELGRQGFHARHCGFQVLLEEEFALDAGRRAQKRHRTPLQVLQHQRRHQRVIACQVQLGELGGRIDDAIWIGELAALGAAGLGGGHGFAGRSGRARIALDVFDWHCLLPGNGPHRLVLPQSSKDRMTDVSASRPLAKRHLCNQFGLDPAYATRGGRVRDRLLVGLDGRQALLQRHQAGVIEPRAHLAGIAQAAILLGHGKQQRPQPRAAALRRGVADDGKFLAPGAFDLDPGICAARHVGRGQALGHDAFQPHLAGCRHQIRRRGLQGLAEPQMVVFGGVHQLLQQRPAHRQGFLAQIPLPDERKIKGIEDDILRALAVEGVLQRLEVRNALAVEHHDFAVDPRPFGRQRAKRVDQMRQLGAPVVAVAGIKTHVVAFDPHHQPVAVELHFVQPVRGVVGHTVHQRGELRFQMRRQIGGHAGQGALAVGRRFRLVFGPIWGWRFGRPQRDHAVGHFVHHAELPLRPGERIAILDEQPGRLLVAFLAL